MTEPGRDSVEDRRAYALGLAVDLRKSKDGDVTAVYVLKTAKSFEDYLANGTVPR